jgi:hypothetical protein
VPSSSSELGSGVGVTGGVGLTGGLEGGVPVGPDDPEGPDGPEVPDVPVGPDEPDGPEVPVGPEEPDGPPGPDVPVGPDVPDVPVAPDGPDDPVDPDVPVGPMGPDDPVEPVDPAGARAIGPPGISIIGGTLKTPPSIEPALPGAKSERAGSAIIMGRFIASNGEGLMGVSRSSGFGSTLGLRACAGRTSATRLPQRVRAWFFPSLTSNSPLGSK